ncbi:cytochrome b/b6 domain-containing protein [Zhongshania arctica]|uniref:Cytochrome b/b6 domain-containing protein n=1 Tax=Zhongshania arctica TaxID=3238302 RepID=A0ABV3TZX7_9GAMM|tara:strand:- start:4392 stop:4943 length:552 start_codon:yes stop_codon:yes gene_type:complete
MVEHTHSYPTYAKAIHLGIAVFGITAFLTGEWAEGSAESLGYLAHAYLGLSLAAFMLLRISAGLSGQQALSFRGWSPFSRRQWGLALEDLRTLLRLGVPERGPHQGLSGITQAFGLILFAWMAISGTALFVLGSGVDSSIFEFIEETHEVGESLIPLYLALHVGAVILHTLSGEAIWKKMFNR